VSRKTVISLLLAAVTIAVYWPVASHPFVAYDDPGYVADNPQVHSGLSWAGLVWAFSHLVVSNWHPLTTLSHMLDCEIFGVSPGAHHVVNLCLHATNTALLFLLLVRMTQTTWRSAMVAALFALHPLHVESVAWIAERKDVLSGFFFMLTLLAYTSYVRRAASVARPPSAPACCGSGGPALRFVPNHLVEACKRAPASCFYVAAVALFLLGLLCKPMLVTLPFVLMLLDYWPLRRWEVKNPSATRILVLEKLPFLALSAVCSVVTLEVQAAGGAMDASAGIPLADRLTNAVLSYCVYAVRFLWPANLAVIYPHPGLTHLSPSLWKPVGMTMVLILASGVCWYWRTRRPWLPVGWFWYLGMLVPVIGVVQVGTQAMADRYTYLPLIGLAVVFVWPIADWLCGIHTKHGTRPTGSSGVATVGLAFAVLFACALATRHQLHYWRSTTALFEHAVAVTKDNTAARGLLAVGLESEGRLDEAIGQYRMVAAVNPAFHAHLALLLSRKGAWSEAAEQYRSAVTAAPKDARVRLELAETLQQMGRDGEAAAEFEAAVRLEPDSIEALNNLAWLRATHPDPELRNGPQAVELAERACRLTQEKQTVILGTLAAAYAEAGRFEDAVAWADKACASAAEKGESGLLERNGELMKMYKEHRPFHREGGLSRVHN
jgi:protein O-mannosyl-transferase